ncbi:GntR family transcriptional regulator [Pseudorhodoferax sp.]|uniref:GntR family transcriptional regulator n=1 Tax=Pseudorhodoferax sp. TaxID=1993553 RepID=UPI002DD627B2|nr:GntR family transcriptional regulator [Pseudorhodoferax sp.]
MVRETTGSPRSVGVASKKSPDITRPSPLGDQVYEALLSQLILLKIAPGSRISVDSLVREMGVSQTPIRAALIRLENEGLVVKEHNVGYSAAPSPSRERIDEIYEMRLLLEPFLAARAASRMTDASRAELLALEKKMTTPASADAKLAYGKFAVHDADFHAWIARHSGHVLAAEALARLYAHTQLYRLRFHATVTDEAIEEHALVVKALVQGDARAAKAAMERHIQRSRKRMTPGFDDQD